jgi:hypothetical protein
MYVFGIEMSTFTLIYVGISWQYIASFLWIKILLFRGCIPCKLDIALADVMGVVRITLKYNIICQKKEYIIRPTNKRKLVLSVIKRKTFS